MIIVFYTTVSREVVINAFGNFSTVLLSTIAGCFEGVAGTAHAIKTIQRSEQRSVLYIEYFLVPIEHDHNISFLVLSTRSIQPTLYINNNGVWKYN